MHTDENSAAGNHLVVDTITSNYARNGGRSGGYDNKPARNLVVDCVSDSSMAFDGRNMDTHEISPTLQSKAMGGYSLNYTPMVVDRQLAAPLVARQAKGGFTDPVNDNIIAFSSKDDGRDAPDNLSPTLRAQNHNKSHLNGGGQVAIASSCIVRRLTPTECERLQGFPDGWTDGQSDSVRYKQLGNAVAVPVVAWIGKRIAAVLDNS